jgi:hypothetical protein
MTPTFQAFSADRLCTRHVSGIVLRVCERISTATIKGNTERHRPTRM